jgi:acyl carrier protein
VPYSWDVRLGHKSREEALAELDDEIDEARVARILDALGVALPLPAPEEGRLVCHYVSETGVAPDELHRHLAARLPREVLPVPVRVEALPLTPNGKVDRAALPRAPRLREAPAPTSRPPRDGIERRLAEIWAEVLRVERVGAEDDFLELGGDSLAAIQIAARAEAAGLALTAVDVFRARTVARLAEAAGTAVPPASSPAPAARAELDAASRARLAALFGSRGGG